MRSQHDTIVAGVSGGEDVVRLSAGKGDEPQPTVLLDASGRHKYLQLRDLLAVLVRQLPPGAALPTERELCDRFGVSRSTVRQALTRLEAEQRIFRRQGSGTYVAEPKIEQPLELVSHTEYMRARGLNPASRLIESLRCVPDPEVTLMLGLAEGAEALKIERVRLADGDPLALETLFLDAVRFEGATAALEEMQSLYQVLHTRYGVDLVSAEETIEAVLADAREAELLDVLPGAPLLRLSRQSRDAEGVPVEYVRSLYRGDRFRFHAHLERFALSPATTPEVTIRSARPEDADQLGAVFVSSWRLSHPGIVADAILGDLDEKEIGDRLRVMIAAGGSVTTLAENADRNLLGFCRYGTDPDNARRGHIFSLFIAPVAGGWEVGRQLLTHAIDDLRQRNLDPITLWVFDRNETALRLYAPFGFTPDGGRRVEPEFGADAIRLRLTTTSTQ
jgi:GntR family transcriptional regulator